MFSLQPWDRTGKQPDVSIQPTGRQWDQRAYWPKRTRGVLGVGSPSRLIMVIYETPLSEVYLSHSLRRKWNLLGQQVSTQNIVIHSAGPQLLQKHTSLKLVSNFYLVTGIINRLALSRRILVRGSSGSEQLALEKLRTCCYSTLKYLKIALLSCTDRLSGSQASRPWI